MVLAGVSFLNRVLSLVLTVGFWLVAASIVEFAVVSSRGFYCCDGSLLKWLQWLVQC